MVERFGQLLHPPHGRTMVLIALLVSFALGVLSPVARGRVVCHERDGRNRVEGPLERLACCASTTEFVNCADAAVPGVENRCCTDVPCGTQGQAVSTQIFERLTVTPPQVEVLSVVVLPQPAAFGSNAPLLPILPAPAPTSTFVLLI